MTLTRKEILAINPGHELDALIAHYVFGWNILTDGRMESQDKFVIRSVPEYSTDISAAWELRKAMKESGFDLALESLNDSLNAGGDLYHARFFKRLDGDYGEHDSEVSFEHAMGVAALLAVLNL
jgi:hypothetical protein